MSDKRDRVAAQASRKDPKPYAKPTLKKGPVLSRVTSAPRSSDVSDTRLKRDIHPVERLANGLNLYRFSYLWSDVEMVGVLAQEVLEVAPEAVVKGEDGYYRVDYGRLGLRFMTYAELLAERPLAVAA